MKLLAQRTGATFEPHSHGKDKAHGHGHSHSHSHDRPKKGDAIDGHAWLDPDNAKAMVDRIQQALGAKYPDHAAAFKTNAAALAAKLDALAAELDRDLKPIADKPYIVFHDAFQYLERRYGLNVVGSISINPEVPPSAKRLTELRRKIQSLSAVCVFAEPAFDRRLVDNLIEGTSARTGMLDAEGGSLDPGPDLYFTLMRKLASALKGCLAAGVSRMRRSVDFRLSSLRPGDPRGDAARRSRSDRQAKKLAAVDLWREEKYENVEEIGMNQPINWV